MNAIRAVFEDANEGSREVQGAEAVDPRPATMSVARRTLNFFANTNGTAPVFRKGLIDLGSMAPSTSVLADRLLEAHPISVEPGFEGNAGISGGVWLNDGGDLCDALVYLRFSEGTVDLPLHVHEFSDRFIAVADGFGLFHYMPRKEACGELRSVVVQAGDLVVFTRGLVHTFTAPVADLVLLSYHAPFIELNDPRQFAIRHVLPEQAFQWQPVGLVASGRLSRQIVCGCPPKDARSVLSDAEHNRGREEPDEAGAAKEAGLRGRGESR